MFYFLSAVLAILILFYMMPIVVSIDVKKDNKDDKITVGLKTLFGLIKLKSEIPFLTISMKNGKPVLKYKIEVANRKQGRLMAGITKLFSLKEGGDLYRVYKNIKKIIIPVVKYIIKKIRISRFSLKLNIGTGDAAETGVLYGAAWIAIGSIMTLAGSYVNINNPTIVIVPIFSKVQLYIEFNCIISLKSGHIINAGIRAIPALLSSMRR